MTATKVKLTGGSFQDAEGNLLRLGYLEMKLSADENVSGVGNIASGITIKILLDNNASVLGTSALTLTKAATAIGGVTVYTGTITGGDNNAFVGIEFVVAGFSTGANNGTFTCTASTATTITLSNTSGSAETHAGTATASQAVWAGTDMLPDNSYYRVTGYTAAGQPAWGPNNQQVASGSTFDVGTWVPNQVISWNPPLQALELDTNATLNPNQGRLNFEDTATVTWAVDGSGNLQATAAAPAALATEVNSTPVTDQSVLNFEDTPTVKWSNPSGGVVKAVAVASVLDALVNNRVWKAIPGSGSLSPAIGLAPNLTAGGGNGLIAATATQTNFDTMTTSTAPGDVATVCFSGITGSGLNPNIFQIWSTQTLKACKWQAALVDTADVRVWMALCDLYSGNTANLVSDTPNLSIIGFRYSTAAGDTTWQAVCGVGGTCTVVDTGIAVDTLGHSFGISVTQTSISFTIDGVVVATITTNIPANTTRFGDVVSVDNIGLTNTKTVAYAAFSSAE